MKIKEMHEMERTVQQDMVKKANGGELPLLHYMVPSLNDWTVEQLESEYKRIKGEE